MYSAWRYANRTTEERIVIISSSKVAEHLAALALEVFHPFFLVHSAVLDRLLALEVESRPCHAARNLTTTGNHVVHPRLLVR